MSPLGLISWVSCYSSLPLASVQLMHKASKRRESDGRSSLRFIKPISCLPSRQATALRDIFGEPAHLPGVITGFKGQLLRLTLRPEQFQVELCCLDRKSDRHIHGIDVWYVQHRWGVYRKLIIVMLFVLWSRTLPCSS